MSSVASPRIIAAEAVAARWAELRLPFLVAHGLEGYPSQLGRDLDILMPQVLAPWALSEAGRVLAHNGWRIQACPPRLWGARLIAIRFQDGDPIYLELHTIERLRWVLADLGDWREQPTGQIGPFPVHAGLTFCKAVVQPLLAGDTTRLTQEYLRNSLADGDTEVVLAYLTSLFGPRLAERLINASLDLDLATLIGSRGAVMRACLKRVGTHPGSGLRSAPELLVRRLGRLGRVSGARIDLVLPDTDGGQELLHCLRNRLARVFVDIRVVSDRDRKTGLLRRLTELARQRLIIHLQTGSEDHALVVYGAMAASYQIPDARNRIPVLAAEIARTLIGEWATRFPCGGQPEPRPDQSSAQRRGKRPVPEL
ncbi:MAG: hypothetical protein ACRDVM_00140 [Acidimicrobiia bacterium]